MQFGELCAFEMEFMAVMHAPKCARTRACHHIWLESDSIYVVRLLENHSDFVSWRFQ